MSGMYERPVRKPTRLREFDYASAGVYFITMCVQHMEPRFGAIMDGEIVPNTAGEMVARLWEENITRYPGTELDTYVVMPDHMHAIVFLGTDPNIDHNASLTRIVQSFKSLTTVEYTRGVKAGIYLPYDRVLWQRGFNERILRNDRELDIVRAYIESNPARLQEKHDGLPDTPWRPTKL
jgi:REP element-mobilizing transposase RayT